MNYKILILIVAISILIVNANQSFSDQTESTEIKLHKMRTSFIDGGQPLVFVGKLTTDSGRPIYNATIVIKNNQSCPEDQIVGTGTTGKRGEFYIYTIPQVWNEKDNRVTFHAEFSGNEKYSNTVSENRTYVIFPDFAQMCIN
jgi:hypothetical protein